jgi:hypothetical protein
VEADLSLSVALLFSSVIDSIHSLPSSTTTQHLDPIHPAAERINHHQIITASDERRCLLALPCISPPGLPAGSYTHPFSSASCDIRFARVSVTTRRAGSPQDSKRLLADASCGSPTKYALFCFPVLQGARAGSSLVPALTLPFYLFCFFLFLSFFTYIRCRVRSSLQQIFTCNAMQPVPVFGSNVAGRSRVAD